ncbi:uncharacterized protein LOC124197269 isoform X2 [Daphnia pulex]|uniref:uncharacterized protein LOC124197269 isoform X2 n=1 Tax=Daphnia pulex TaxID=6669 RepID=UPI001EDD3735|nr:uncharacterized protein LOC124197269 isoform X2 [Daphnia pulex]
MRLIISAILILSVIAAVTFGEAQHYQYPNSPFIFPGYPMLRNQQSLQQNQPDSRFFFSGLFTTFTYTISTVTSTAVATTVTTCTTSAATLTTCTAGRKRRDEHGVFRNPRGLFYDEKEEEEEERNIFLPTQDQASESETARSSRQMEVQPALPFPIQPTFGAYYTPEMGYNNLSPAVPLSRIFLAFGTATVTVTTTSTSTSKLTAVCKSTTGFSVCTS